MSNYEMWLLLGVGLLSVGAINYVRGMVNGQVSVTSLLMTLAGGGSLFYAETLGPDGVSVSDIVPALIGLFEDIGFFI